MKPTIVLSQVLEDLKNGYTRTTSSPGYDATIGSIEEKYGLNKTQVSQLFKHPQLLNKKTIKRPDSGFIIEDDLTVVGEPETIASVENMDNIDANDTNGVSVQEADNLETANVETVVEGSGEGEDPFNFS